MGSFGRKKEEGGRLTYDRSEHGGAASTTNDSSVEQHMQGGIANHIGHDDECSTHHMMQQSVGYAEEERQGTMANSA